VEILMENIRNLGHLPRLSRERGDEYKLACRLREAKRMGHLNETQLADLDEMARTQGLSAQQRAAPRMLFLMADIRALGRLPRLTPGRQDEYRVACRLREARRMGHLSADQLAELEEMAGTAD